MVEWAKRAVKSETFSTLQTREDHGIPMVTPAAAKTLPEVGRPVTDFLLMVAAARAVSWRVTEEEELPWEEATATLALTHPA